MAKKHGGKMSGTRRDFLRRVAQAGGYRATYLTMQAMGLLGQELIRPAERRPDSVRHRLRPQPLALVEARVGPDVHEPRHRPGHAVHRREQR